MTPDPISLILVDKIFHPIKITESVLIIKHPRLDMWVKLKNRRMIRRSPFYFVKLIFAFLDQPKLDGLADGLGAIGGFQFFQDVTDVGLYSIFRDE